MPLNRPTREELLQAVIDYLQQDLLPQSQGSQRFHLLVVVRVLGIVLRELQQGDAFVRQEAALLTSLLGEGADLDTFADAIADGTLGVDSPELISGLLALAKAKLQIDSPDY